MGVAAPPMLLASAVTSTSHTVSATAPTLPAVLMSPHPSSPTVLHTAPPLVLLLVFPLLLLVLMLAQPPLLLPPPPQLVPRPRPSPELELLVELVDLLLPLPHPRSSLESPQRILPSRPSLVLLQSSVPEELLVPHLPSQPLLSSPPLPPDPRPSRPPSDHPPSLVLEVLLVGLLDLLVPLLLQLPPMQLPPTQPPPLPLVVLVKPPWPVWLVLSVSPPSSYKSTNQPDFSLRIRSISYSCLLHNTERKREPENIWVGMYNGCNGRIDGWDKANTLASFSCAHILPRGVFLNFFLSLSLS